MSIKISKLFCVSFFVKGMSKLPPPPPTPPPPPPSNIPPMLPPPPPPLPKSEPPILEQNLAKQPSIKNGTPQQSISTSYQTPKTTNTITETIEKFDQLLKSSSNNNTHNGSSKSNGNGFGNSNSNAQILTTPVSHSNNNSKIKNAAQPTPTPTNKQFPSTTLNDLTSNEHYALENSNNNNNNRNVILRPQSESISFIPEEITPIIITGAPEITKNLINAGLSSNVSNMPRATSLLVNEQQTYISTSKQSKSKCLKFKIIFVDLFI